MKPQHLWGGVFELAGSCWQKNAGRWLNFDKKQATKQQAGQLDTAARRLATETEAARHYRQWQSRSTASRPF
jgi:hypothetical protein